MLAAFAAGSAGEDECSAIEHHVLDCANCRDTLALLATTAPRSAEERPWSRGGSVGRYLLLDRIGAGAMGEVFEAYDPQLDRKVALKRMRDASHRPRFLREARAMAAVAHPNVIAVYEVDTDFEQAFIAMELVTGGTLADWLRRTPRTPGEIVAAFEQAAQGLAAAHREGLFHRDFKPANVLVGDDGRVRVCDFGLARFGDQPRAGATTRNEAATTVLTHDGGLVGTPAYMAPEQLTGERGDARSDQFSFCVCLYEALFGQRPYRGETIAQLVEAMDKPASCPPASGLSRPVRRALTRGLNPDPTRRFESIDGLLPSLSPSRWSRTAPWLLAATILGTGFVVRGVVSPPQSPSPCPPKGSDVPGVWDDDRRALFADIDTREGIGTAVVDKVDVYAVSWSAARSDACEATLLRGEQSGELMDLRIACLSRVRAELDGTLVAVADAIGRKPDAALASLRSLAPLEPCRDAEALLDGDRVSAEDESALNAAYAQLAQAKVGTRVGDWNRSETILEEIFASEVAAYPPLQTRARLVEAVLFGNRTPTVEAATAGAEALESALEYALAHDQWRYAAEAASNLSCITSNQLGQHDLARKWIPIARGLSDRVPEDTNLRAHVLSCQAEVELGMGDYAAAIQPLEEAVAIAEKDNNPARAAYRQMLVSALHQTDRLDEAERHARLAIAELQALKSAQVSVAKVYYELAWVFSGQKRYVEALTAAQEAVALNVSSPDTDRWLGAIATSTVADVQEKLGQLGQAEASFVEAAREAEDFLGDHPVAVSLIGNHGRFLLRQKRLKEARPIVRRALEMAKRTLPEGHPDRTVLHNNLREAQAGLDGGPP